jgi:hypothetical protein
MLPSRTDRPCPPPRPSRFWRLSILLLVGLGVEAPSAALGQTAPSVDTSTWRPSVDPEAGLALEPVETPGPWRANVGLWLQFAQSPVAVRDPAGSGTLNPVRHAFGMDLVAALGLGERAEVGVDVPAVLWQDGDSNLPGSVVAGGAAPATRLGDVALRGKVTIVSNDRQGVRMGPGLAAIASVALPTGDPASFLGDAALASSLVLDAAYGIGFAELRASLGYFLRTERRTLPNSPSGVTFGDEIPWSLGAVVRPKAVAPALDSDDRQIWELAAHGWLPAGPVAPFGAGASSLSPALLSLSDRVSLGAHGDFFVVCGGEVGLDSAIGVPVVRGVLSIGWAPRKHDRDDDGVPDDVDECPDLPEDRDGIQDKDGCPEDDADGDEIPDAVDACPEVKGTANSDPKKNGCPAEGVETHPVGPPGGRP